jgi:hypothetical protein
MLACGWRPNIDQEKKAWKGAAKMIRDFILGLLFSLALTKVGGMNLKNAVLISICLGCFVAGAAWFWCYKKRSRDMKKLDNELLCNRKDKPKE